MVKESDPMIDTLISSLIAALAVIHPTRLLSALVPSVLNCLLDKFVSTHI